MIIERSNALIMAIRDYAWSRSETRVGMIVFCYTRWYDVGASYG